MLYSYGQLYSLRLVLFINHWSNPNINFFLSLSIMISCTLNITFLVFGCLPALLHYAIIFTNNLWMWEPDIKSDSPGESLQALAWQIQCFSKDWLVSSRLYLLVETALESWFGLSFSQRVWVSAVKEPQGQKAAAWPLPNSIPAELRARSRYPPSLATARFSKSLMCIGVPCLWKLGFGLLMSSKLDGNGKAGGKMA